ncbi:MAG: DNA methyltransferase [Anaerolineae bacterium]
MSQQIAYPGRAILSQWLHELPAKSQDVIVLITGALDLPRLTLETLRDYLDASIRALREGGLLFIQGRPDYLPEVGAYLDQHLTFKYWIAIESELHAKVSGLPSVHAAVLLFTKGNQRFNVRRVRFPHRYCAFCGRSLRDWGGKSHLMHPEGYVISDVWKDLPPADNYARLSRPVLDIILRMVDFGTSHQVHGLVGPREGIEEERSVMRETAIQYVLPWLQGNPPPSSPAHDIDPHLVNVVHCGDALEILRQYPDNSIDLVFADPPYNLDKRYNVYEDEQEDASYLTWCNAWLEEYVRVLKPTGSLYVLNLPRWGMYHATFLNQRLYFQNWIVWDAVSEPRGKLMPAHYALLFYTKHPYTFTFNYADVCEIDARCYCRRAGCIHQRKAAGHDEKEPLTDIWWDIYRIKHKRDRDYHPCQLPQALMERIIRLSTNPGDIVLDAMAGTGTTAVAAAQLGRRYVAIDIDEAYVNLTRQKLAVVGQGEYVRVSRTRKQPRPYTKKELQLELRAIAQRLGRLPTPEDVERMSRYKLEVFYEMFPTWGKALKAAKIDIRS